MEYGIVGDLLALLVQSAADYDGATENAGPENDGLEFDGLEQRAIMSLVQEHAYTKDRSDFLMQAYLFRNCKFFYRRSSDLFMLVFQWSFQICVFV